MFGIRKTAAALAAAVCLTAMASVPAVEAQTLKVAMNSDVKILDPIWTTAYIQRDFGYMVWDTLFAVDSKFEVKPQMVDKYSVSPDKLTWTFTLRDGLKWSNGQPVTSEDCIASIKRWAAKDSMGQKMMESVAGFQAVDAKTFKMNMKEPYGLVLESLGKPSSNVPFMMPKKTAETDPNTQIKIEDVIGSGPFMFSAKEWKPGEKVVFLKNPNYTPRSDPPSGLAGAKIAKVDRVEWIWIPDVQTHRMLQDRAPAARVNFKKRAAHAGDATRNLYEIFGWRREFLDGGKNTAVFQIQLGLAHGVQAGVRKD